MRSLEHRHKLPASQQIVLSSEKIRHMSALIVLVLISLLVAASFLGAFIWSVYADQYNDRDGAAMRMLFDDEIQQHTQQ